MLIITVLNAGDLPSLAYPGTACLSGWTSACATTVQRASGKQYFQTWCCPSGWDCLTISSGQDQIPHRECVSLLTTPTEVWINDIATTGGGESTASPSWRKVSLSNLPSGGPIVVNHPAFPLYGRVPVGDGEAAKQTGLSTRAVAGIAIGIAVVVLVLLGSCAFVCMKKRKQDRAGRLTRPSLGPGEGNSSYGGRGHDTKKELTGHDTEMQETYSLSRSPAELSSQARVVEVGAESRPVELAS
ncbi:hypothetical protein CTA2_12043 [Colletotrichum tanaceti]|uniref:Uncharacterized protein n=1 Tax=Colletotrichum tanaceti TaxID=1306861 RepID=A0A4U6X2I5_9PEZI|nr:hypothetical protein CTA2_12043 [Colletotrichum tanaceti]TKW49204.1 hypothetical protein CTA1_13313 [Colletotrichum tanaceti]